MVSWLVFFELLHLFGVAEKEAKGKPTIFWLKYHTWGFSLQGPPQWMSVFLLASFTSKSGVPTPKKRPENEGSNNQKQPTQRTLGANGLVSSPLIQPLFVGSKRGSKKNGPAQKNLGFTFFTRLLPKLFPVWRVVFLRTTGLGPRLARLGRPGAGEPLHGAPGVHADRPGQEIAMAFERPVASFPAGLVFFFFFFPPFFVFFFFLSRRVFFFFFLLGVASFLFFVGGYLEFLACFPVGVASCWSLFLGVPRVFLLTPCYKMVGHES